MSEIDPRLSRLYRETSAEGPPAAVDAAILAAARQRLAAPKQRAPSRWSRWLVPASLTATLVLGVSISLLIEREHPEMLTGETAVPAPPRLAPLGDTATAKPEVEAPAAARRAEKPIPTFAGTMPAAPAEPAALSPPAASLRAKPSAADAFPAERSVNSAEPSAAVGSSDAAAGAAASQGAITPATRPAAAKSAPMRMETSQRSPESWLDDIRRLKREGRDKEAAEQLAEFRKMYPDFSVPEDLSR